MAGKKQPNKKPKDKTEHELALREELRKKSKQANLRMTTLRKQGAESQALLIAENMLKKVHGEDAKGFKSNKKMTFNQVETELKLVNRFLQSKGSTKKGMLDTINKRDSTFLEKYGDKISERQLSHVYNILSDDYFSKANDILQDSNQLLDIVLNMYKDSEEKYAGNARQREMKARDTGIEHEIIKRLEQWQSKFTGTSTDTIVLEDLQELFRL